MTPQILVQNGKAIHDRGPGLGVGSGGGYFSQGGFPGRVGPRGMSVVYRVGKASW